MRIGVVAVGLAVLAGCATRTPAPPPVEPAPAPGPLVPALTAAAYVERSGSASLSLLRSAELAAVRSRDPALRAFAERLAGDHRGISAQLSFAGRRLNLLPPAVPTGGDAARLAALEATGDFDAAYRRFLAAMVGEVAAVHAAYAARGESPTLRPVAAMAAPIVKAELAALRGL